MAVWVTGHGWTQAGDAGAMTRDYGCRCLLTDAEQAEYDRLAAWFLQWQPPEVPYDLGQHCIVHKPQLSHAERCRLVRGGCTGQVQRSCLIWMRAHAKRFGGPT